MSTFAPARLGYRPAGRGRWAVVDLLWVAWLAWIFDWINNLAPVRQSLAEHNGAHVLSLERTLHIAPEQTLNAWLLGHHILTRLVVLYYENVHAGVTFALFLWLWWRRYDLLRPLRAALLAASLVALAVFWSFPVAPPRMLARPRFEDLVALVAGGNPHWPPGAQAVHSNQLSALPSLHIVWAVWSSAVIFQLTHRRSIRACAVVYPALTTCVVMATANHYALDALSGALLGAAAVWAALRLWPRRVPGRA